MVNITPEKQQSKSIEAPVKNWSPPVHGKIEITSHWGESRTYDLSKGQTSRPHKGVDIRAREGTPVYAIGDGKAIVHNWRPGGGKNEIGGNWVIIQHPNGVRSGYIHLGDITVKNGQKVTGGELIGYSGSTGGRRAFNPKAEAMDPHLHFMIEDKPNHKIAPYDYIKGYEGKGEKKETSVVKQEHQSSLGECVTPKEQAPSQRQDIGIKQETKSTQTSPNAGVINQRSSQDAEANIQIEKSQTDTGIEIRSPEGKHDEVEQIDEESEDEITGEVEIKSVTICRPNESQGEGVPKEFCLKTLVEPGETKSGEDTGIRSSETPVPQECVTPQEQDYRELKAVLGLPKEEVPSQRQDTGIKQETKSTEISLDAGVGNQKFSQDAGADIQTEKSQPDAAIEARPSEEISTTQSLDAGIKDSGTDRQSESMTREAEVGSEKTSQDAGTDIQVKETQLDAGGDVTTSEEISSAESTSSSTFTDEDLRQLQQESRYDFQPSEPASEPSETYAQTSETPDIESSNTYSSETSQYSGVTGYSDSSSSSSYG